MTERIIVKPSPGRLVRHPGDYRPLADDGETVEKTAYWVRKLRAGDVVTIKPAAQAKSIKGEK